MLIYKALYGLRSSGKMWSVRFSKCLREIGFFPCRMEPDIWIRKNGYVYKYIAVYVDDLAIAAKKPAELIKLLEDEYKFKLKGSGPMIISGTRMDSCVMLPRNISRRWWTITNVCLVKNPDIIIHHHWTRAIIQKLMFLTSLTKKVSRDTSL